MGLTLEDLSRKMGYKKNWASRFLTQQSRSMRLNDLERLAEILGVSVAELVKEGDSVVWGLTPNEREMLELFRLLPEHKRLALVELLEWMRVRREDQRRGGAKRRHAV